MSRAGSRVRRDCIDAVDDFHVNVKVLLMLAVPAKGDLTAIRRKRGVQFDARIAGEWDGRGRFRN